MEGPRHGLAPSPAFAGEQDGPRGLGPGQQLSSELAHRRAYSDQAGDRGGDGDGRRFVSFVVALSQHRHPAVGEAVERGVEGGATQLAGQPNLQHAGYRLWEEVKYGLAAPGTSPSGGQQQRLCIARAIATEPEVILMDEPCSALDPIATARIEELIRELEKKFTIVIVTHSMQQAERLSDETAFFHMGKIIEAGPTAQIFNNPLQQQTRDYIDGKFG